MFEQKVLKMVLDGCPVLEFVQSLAIGSQIYKWKSRTNQLAANTATTATIVQVSPVLLAEQQALNKRIQEL